jgi:hypothetical protein
MLWPGSRDFAVLSTYAKVCRRQFEGELDKNLKNKMNHTTAIKTVGKFDAKPE